MKEIDFVNATLMHISDVKVRIGKCIDELMRRAFFHDESKLFNPEYDGFLKHTENLRGLSFGSKEYEKNIKEMQETINHHYACKNNRHHPQNHKNGIKDMDFVDMIEMVSDWHAATKRHSDGDIYKSLEINQQKFGFSDDLKLIMKNTIENYFLNFEEMIKVCIKQNEEENKPINKVNISPLINKTCKYKIKNTGIIEGYWNEDGSPFEITCPAQLQDSFLHVLNNLKDSDN